jgi:hypothetical protein
LQRLQRQQLLLERRKERLRHGVVPTVCPATHACTRVELMECGEVVITAVPTVAVGVVDPVRFQLSGCGSHAQRGEGELRVDAVRHCPAHHAPGIQVERHGQEQLSVGRRDVRDVACEHPVGRRHREVSRLRKQKTTGPKSVPGPLLLGIRRKTLHIGGRLVRAVQGLPVTMVRTASESCTIDHRTRCAPSAFASFRSSVPSGKCPLPRATSRIMQSAKSLPIPPR